MTARTGIAPGTAIREHGSGASPTKQYDDDIRNVDGTGPECAVWIAAGIVSCGGILDIRRPHASFLLLFVNQNLSKRLAISIGAFGGRSHRLAAVRHHSTTGGLVRPTRFLAFVGQGVEEAVKGILTLSARNCIASSTDVSWRMGRFRPRHISLIRDRCSARHRISVDIRPSLTIAPIVSASPI
jgi:hypothetical protein